MGVMVPRRKIRRAKSKPTNGAQACRLPSSCDCRVTTADILVRPTQPHSGTESHVFERSVKLARCTRQYAFQGGFLCKWGGKTGEINGRIVRWEKWHERGKPRFTRFQKVTGHGVLNTGVLNRQPIKKHFEPDAYRNEATPYRREHWI